LYDCMHASVLVSVIAYGSVACYTFLHIYTQHTKDYTYQHYSPFLTQDNHQA
jgi:hypothetical protein